jgi:hypothetical protein
MMYMSGCPVQLPSWDQFPLLQVLVLPLALAYLGPFETGMMVVDIVGRCWSRMG